MTIYKGSASKGQKVAAKHSDGPWRFDPNDVAALEHSQRVDPKKRRIEAIGVSSPGGYVVSIAHEPEDGYDLIGDPAEHVANLTLISAAPDMEDACETAEQLLASITDLPSDLSDFRHTALLKLRAALAKARGGK